MDHVVYFLVARVTHFQPATFRSSWFTFRLMIVTLPDILHPFPYALALFSFSIHQFFSSLSLCEPRGFSFAPFFIPPSIFALLISHSFQSTPIRFLRPLPVHFVQFRVVILPVLQFFLHSLTMFFFFSIWTQLLIFRFHSSMLFWVSLSP